MGKKRVLCFGDSLTWGFDPYKKIRMEDEDRWTGVLQKHLGSDFVVIEEGHNGRTIATDDPAEGEKNGLKYVIPCIESQSPLDLMIILLGANDLKRKFQYTSMDIAGEMQIFLEKVQSHNRFRMGDSMKVLLISPPIIGACGEGSWLYDCFDFERCSKVSLELSNWYKQLSEMYGCMFLDAAKVCAVSSADGVHLDIKNQRYLGEAVYRKLKDEGFCQ